MLFCRLSGYHRRTQGQIWGEFRQRWGKQRHEQTEQSQTVQPDLKRVSFSGVAGRAMFIRSSGRRLERRKLHRRAVLETDFCGGGPKLLSRSSYLQHRSFGSFELLMLKLMFPGLRNTARQQSLLLRRLSTASQNH